MVIAYFDGDNAASFLLYFEKPLEKSLSTFYMVYLRIRSVHSYTSCLHA